MTRDDRRRWDQKYGGAELPESLVADAYDFDFQADTWVDLIFPAAAETDYIELMTQSGAEFYEIEILSAVPEPTVVRALSWGQIKRR